MKQNQKTNLTLTGTTLMRFRKGINNSAASVIDPSLQDSTITTITTVTTGMCDSLHCIK